MSATKACGCDTVKVGGLFRYLNLYHRLLALTESDPENPNSCWLWKGATKGRNSLYPKMNVWCGGKTRTLAAHRVALVVMELDGEWDLFWDLYQAYSIAGFEADHSPHCESPLCVNPEHLQWLDAEEHRRVTVERRGHVWHGRVFP